MGIGYFEIYVLKQAVLINWAGRGAGRCGGDVIHFKLYSEPHQILQVLNTGLATKKLQMGDTGDWDHFENVQGSQDWGWRSNISLLFWYDVKFGLKYLCIYMRHECAGETQWDKPFTNNNSIWDMLYKWWKSNYQNKTNDPTTSNFPIKVWFCTGNTFSFSIGIQEKNGF